MYRATLAALVLTTALSSNANAQAFEAIFSDQSTDQVLFTMDINNDGDVNDPGEVTVFFDANNASGLESPSGNVYTLAQGNAGEVYAGDGDTDTVYLLRDLNGDNNAQGVGEATVWFSADNAEGNPLQTPNGLARGADGAVYVVQADTVGSPTQDVVYRTVDLNGDGDANDEGESSVWLDLGALALGSSPFEIDFDGNVAYIADTAGGSPRTYRAEDANGNGVIDSDEVNQFIRSDDFIFALSVYAEGGDVFNYNLMSDEILRYRDSDGNNVIDLSTESTTVIDVSSIVDGAIFDLAFRDNEMLMTVNAFNDDDQLLRFIDLNADGDFMDDGELSVLLQQSVQGEYPMRPRSIIYYTAANTTAVSVPSTGLLLGTVFLSLVLRRRS